MYDASRASPRTNILHPVADHHVGPRLQLGQEARYLLEVVGEVGVRHQDVSPSGDGEAGQVGAPAAPLTLVNHDRADSTWSKLAVSSG